MSNPRSISFDRQLIALRDRLGTEWRWPSPEAGFACHVYAVSGDALPAACNADLSGLAEAGLDHAPLLAALAYLLPSQCPPDMKKIMGAWASGLHRLTTRNPFPIDRQSFAYRPYEVLGICLGVSRCGDLPLETTKFVRNVTAQVTNDPNSTTRSRLLTAYAGLAVGASWPSSLVPDVRQCDLGELALLRWLIMQASLAQQMGTSGGLRNDLDRALMERALAEPTVAFDLGRAAIVYNSLRATVHGTIGASLTAIWAPSGERHDAIAVVENICRRFQLLARQIRHRHDNRTTLEIKDEYDVQDLLHSVLVLHFDDVRPEEWSPSYAATSTRMDFLLKQEKVVIEAKKTRKALDQKKVLEELAVDKMRYRTHPDCRALVCFVYDPEGLCHNPVALERDASEVTEGFRVQVIVAPHGV